MEIIIFDLIGGLISQIITWLSIKTKISQTTLSLLLPIVLGIAYFLVKTYLIDTHPAEREEIMGVVSGSYASSQLFYNYFKTKGRIPEKK